MVPSNADKEIVAVDAAAFTSCAFVAKILKVVHADLTDEQFF